MIHTDDTASAIINSTATNEINLKGIAIGNGWIDPKQQYPGYVDFAYEKGLLKKDTPVSTAFVIVGIMLIGRKQQRLKPHWHVVW